MPQPKVAQDGAPHEMIAVRHHQAARQNARSAFEDAHVDVQHKEGYTLGFQMGGGKGDLGRVGCSQKLSHMPRLTAY
mgnify:FL=1